MPAIYRLTECSATHAPQQRGAVILCFWAVVGGLVLLSASACAAQVVFGAIVDDGNEQPVEGVEVSLLLGDSVVARGISNSEGLFRLEGPQAGQYTVRLVPFGYESPVDQPLVLPAARTIRRDFRLSPDPVALEPLEVVAKPYSLYLEREGFYSRMERGLGDFMEINEIERYPSFQPSHVIRSMGVTIRNGRIAGCRLLVDGMQIDWDVPLDDIISKDHMFAVEYHSFHVPVELRRHTSQCVVAIWTTGAVQY